MDIKGWIAIGAVLLAITVICYVCCVASSIADKASEEFYLKRKGGNLYD